MKKNILVLIISGFSMLSFQACKNSGSSKKTTTDTATHNDAMTNTSGGDAMVEHNQMMKKMMEEMNTMTMTGDFDLDFATMMIPHHQSAVEMAEMYLPKGKDEKIKSMAQNIVTSQKKEIEELKGLIARHNTAGKKEAHADNSHGDGEHNELMEAMNTMMDKMKGMQMSGNADKDFVTMMIPHHESAVIMSQNEISHGKHFEMKKMAQKIIEDQNMEIKQFQEWLAKIK